MSSVVAQRQAFTSAELARLRALNLPETDGKPMDSDWQRIVTTLLIEIARHAFRRKRGYFGGNLCVYYSLQQSLDEDFLGPDFFYVRDADPHRLRKKWEVWNENNQFPNLIVEYLSPSTRANDLGKKKDLYEQTFQTREYFAYDPDNNTLLGWRLSPITNRYEPLEVGEKGRMFSEELKLWIGPWRGKIQGQMATWLRFFHEDGHLVLSPEEDARQLAAAERAEKEVERAAKEAALAAEETERAAKEVERAAKEAALAEVERLRKLLDSQ